MYIAIASQTAGPNWLNLCDGTQKYVKKKLFLLSKLSKFHWQLRSLQLVYIIKLFAHIYMLAYMAGRNWLNFCFSKFNFFYILWAMPSTTVVYMVDNILTPKHLYFTM